MYRSRLASDPKDALIATVDEAQYGLNSTGSFILRVCRVCPEFNLIVREGALHNRL